MGLKQIGFTLAGLALCGCATRGNYAEYWGEFPYPTLDTIGYVSSDQRYPDAEAHLHGRHIEDFLARESRDTRHAVYVADQNRYLRPFGDEFIQGPALNPTVHRAHMIEPHLHVSVPGHAFPRR